MLKVGIIGCGGIGGYHYGHIDTFKDIAQFAAFCDIIPERAQEFAKKAGLDESHAYADFKEMLEKEDLNCVFICVPPYAHGEIEEEIIKRRLDFFVEKPLALDLELAKNICKKVKDHNIITSVGFQCRYDDLVDPIKEFCAKNPIPQVNCTRFSSVPGAPWWKVKEQSGGQIVEQTIHQLDYIRYVIGEPEEVFTMAHRGYITQDEVPGYDTDDVSITCVRFENGTLCTISTGCYATGSDAYNSRTIFSSRDKRGEMRLATDFEIFGQIPEETEGMGDLVVKGDGGLANASNKGVLISNKVPDSYGFKCDRTFLEAVMNRDASKIRCDYEDGMKTVAFGLACNKSMETGLPVKVKDLLK